MKRIALPICSEISSERVAAYRRGQFVCAILSLNKTRTNYNRQQAYGLPLLVESKAFNGLLTGEQSGLVVVRLIKTDAYFFSE